MFTTENALPVSQASTYLYGNLGIAVSAAAITGPPPVPACDAYGYLQITNAMNLAISGIDRFGKLRQTITFSVSPTSPAPLNILDAYGNPFMTISAGQQIALNTNSTLVVSGATGTAAVTIGQIFLQQ